jgi:radical SAM superfamily enzyme YgiQ (UPF0313 family)
VARHFDSVVVGEAELVWPRVVVDMVSGNLRKMYRAPFAPPLDGIPPPRYDLVEPEFEVPMVTEATRGCPFRCSYCQLNIRPAPHRCRPIDEVLGDLTATSGLPFHKRKMAMLYDNNLGGNMKYAKELLREIAGLGLWGLGVQFALNCLNDDEFLDLLADANCRMAFLGMESLNEPSLRAVNKTQNKVREYEHLFGKIKERGILIFAGTMLALDEDTPDYYDQLPEKLEQVDPSAIFLSLSIPIPGTAFQKKMLAEGRIVDDDLSHYDGDHLLLRPRHVSPEEIYDTFEGLNRRFYSWKSIGKRWFRFLKSYLWNWKVMTRLIPALFSSFILLKLSLFQRGHARDRVFPLVEKGRRRIVLEGEEETRAAS